MVKFSNTSRIRFRKALADAIVMCALIASQVSDAELNTRWKWTTSIVEIPDTNVMHETEGNFQLDNALNLRIEWSRRLNNWYIDVEPVIAAAGGDSVRLGRSLVDETGQTIEPDRGKRFDLSTTFRSGGTHSAIGYVDKLAVRYQRPDFAFTIGRQALSWGSGILFQPLDLFNPYSPTAVDREYKPGTDLLLLEGLVGTHSEWQLLYIARADEADVTSNAATVAMKWQRELGSAEIELLLAQHFDDDIQGVVLRLPIAGSLLRMDMMRACAAACYMSGVVNMDYTFVVQDSLVYVFGEYYRNGFGLDASKLELNSVPETINARLARGEVFTMMQDYAAVGAQFFLHPTVSQTVAVLANLHDKSSLLQTFWGFDPSDKLRLQAGLTLSLGEGEFGKLEVGEDGGVGGGANAFVSLAMYF